MPLEGRDDCQAIQAAIARREKVCVGQKKHLGGRLIATRQSTPYSPLSDVA